MHLSKIKICIKKNPLPISIFSNVSMPRLKGIAQNVKAVFHVFGFANKASF